MPLIRKIIEVGKTSKAVIIPKSWLEFFEKDIDQHISEVSIEVDRVLTIAPILPKSRSQEGESR